MHAYLIPDEALDSPDVAVVGIAVRLPGALDTTDYWSNLHGARECIARLSEEDLRAAGVGSAELHDPNYVRAAAPIDRLELFDAPFFGFSKREASVLDPQHRHFLEVCYEALESAGIVPEAFEGAIGVFGGSGMNAYMPYNLFTNPELMRSMGLFLVRHTGNDKDFLTTRVSYCLNLKGPSVNVQTACSTSLVAIHLACQSLLSGECDAALAGGVTIELPHHRGYRYEEGEILSPDGHCRPFESRSKGTVFGSGAGVVVLKRLRDAIRDGDFIHALVKGSAVNNDGNRKVGYLAPSVDGQAECIVEALEVAGLSARDITYVECHGTGTPVGDPIEVQALAQAFSRSTTEKQFCGIGSVKSNIGHLDTAAGVASFVKVVQMLEHEAQVPTLHFEKPNPEIDFAATPFFVVGQERPWPRVDTPRRAGVSSLGVGGTNAHVIVEEAPRRRPAQAGRGSQLIVLSARSAASLERASSRFARHLAETPELALADVSSTLLRGRRAFPFRRVLAATSLAEARELVTSGDRARVFDITGPVEPAPVIFLFPGGGAQHANMAREIYETEPKFREIVDRCLAILKKQEGLDLAPLLFPAPELVEQASKELERPSLALPALLTIEIAFARLLGSWGIKPAAMIGHSLGEYAAAHLADVITLEAALGIVCCRGRLFERVPPGGMLSVPLGVEALTPLLKPGLAIAAVNAPEMCVVSGSNADLDELAKTLAARDVEARRLHIDVPAHSPLLEPILGEFRAYLEKVRFGSLASPFVSNLNGTFVADGELSPDYFVKHLSRTVRFAEGMAAVFEKFPSAVLVEVGPGQTLASLARLQPGRKPAHGIVPLSPHVKDPTAHGVFLTTSIGRIWAYGGKFDLDAFSGQRRNVPLPPTPFEHERYWIEPGKSAFVPGSTAAEGSARDDDISRWFYKTTFREEPRPAANFTPGERWLVLAEGAVARSLALEIRAVGADPVLVTPGEMYERVAPGHYAVRLSDPQDYDDALQAVITDGGLPRRIVHALALSADAEPGTPPRAEVLDRVFYSLLHLAQALGQEDVAAGTELVIASSRAFDVADTQTLRPLHALLQGPALVIPREIPEIRARLLDLLDPADPDATARLLVNEALAPSDHGLVALRGGLRYVRTLERVGLDRVDPVVLPERPVVLVTGGLGGIGRTLAKHLFQTRRARLVLVGRTPFPAPQEREKLRQRLDSRDPQAEQLDLIAALEAEGAEIAVETADVTVREQAERLVSRVRGRFGHIDLVIHAAGTLDDGPLALKGRASAAAVLAPKVDGASFLADALAEDPPAFVLLLSSTSAALAPPGQIDYVAGNAYVGALARALAGRSSSRVIGLGFGVWRDTGMAARATGPFAPRVDGELTGHPLILRERQHGGGGREFASLYDAERLWVLDEHRVRGGGPVLPGTAMVEIARAAGVRTLGLAPRGPLEIRDVLFVTPLEVAEGDARLVKVTVEPEAGKAKTFSVTIASRGRDENEATEHSRALVAAFSGQAAEPLPIADLEARCNMREVRFEQGQQVLPQDQHLAFGPRWQVIRSMRFGQDEAVARLELGERFATDLELYVLHPGLLDMLSGFAFSLADSRTAPDRLRVPLSYQLLRVHAPLERELVSYARLKQANEADGIAVFDVWVADSTGRVLLEIQGYTTKSVSPTVLKHGKRADSEPTLLQRWARQGILESEGAAVLERLLTHASPPELFASPTSLYDMLEELRPRKEPPPPSRAGGAAAAGAESDAPRDDVERRLAEMWTSLLGVESVGIRDNFFELGGHSLIAVRLFARIKKAYGVDLPLAILFQAPTIETCAEILRSNLGIAFALPAARGSSPRASSPEAASDHSLPHLVQIRGNGKGIPFFCVHGAGGNVLNFRSLSQHLGSEQAFYGLQARGVNGEPPANSIEEMADLYLKDMAAVRPHGPYLLGGYSGGGVIALEIAQRLRSAGEEVPLLVFLDTFHPATSPRKLSLRERVERLIDEGPGYLSQRGKAKLSRHLDELSTELKLMFMAANNLPLPLELREVQIGRAFLHAASRYRPKRYDGQILLFRARLIDEIYRHMGPTLGWKDLVPNLEIVEVPGGHDSLVLEPNVQVLTGHLATAIERALGKSRS